MFKKYTYQLGLRSLAVFFSFVFCSLSVALGSEWRSHLAYNAMSEIVVTDNEVFALSGGNIYSINKVSEKKRTYNIQDGLSATGVSHICYDSIHDRLMLFHENGYLDLMTSGGVSTVPDLYVKDMTSSKRVQCSQQEGSTLYLGMSFGILTYNTDDNSFVDSYYIGDEASEVNIHSLCLYGGYLYASSDSLLYRCRLDTALVDYRCWETIAAPNGDVGACASMSDGLYFVSGRRLYRLSAASNAPQHILPQYHSVTGLVSSNGHVLLIDGDNGLIDLTESTVNSVNTLLSDIAIAAYDAHQNEYWVANNSDGIARVGEAMQQLYRNNSPSLNMPYRMYYYGDRLYVVQGGRWSTQYKRAPYVITYENGIWNNIQPSQITSQTSSPVLDLMSVCADTLDPDHYFLTSYGCGVLEMRGSTVVHHWHAGNTPALHTAAASNPTKYTRCDGGVFDSNGRLWIGNGTFRAYTGSEWLSFPLYRTDGSNIVLDTPAEPAVCPYNDNLIAMPAARVDPGIAFLDHKGTLEDTSDDISIMHTIFLLDGTTPFTPDNVYCIRYDLDGVLWVATNKGLYYINPLTDLQSSPILNRLPDYYDPTEFFLNEYEINSLCVDRENRLWVGTKQLGLYILSADRRSLVAHFTTTNSPLPDNNILSVAVSRSGKAIIGTGAGIVEYDEKSEGSGLSSSNDLLATADYSGMMNGWTVHSSYNNVSEVASTGSTVYGLADNALFRLDTNHETLEPVNALSGLSAANIGHIVADTHGRLLIAYKDGNIDIIRADGNIAGITDLQRKALSGKDKLFKDIVFSGQYAYLATDFGVLVLNMQKEEVAEWYRPDGDGNISLQNILIQGDSVYTSTGTTIYSAALSDNLVDHNNWHLSPSTARPDLSFRSHILRSVSVGGCTYSASSSYGIIRQCGAKQTAFRPNGPETNSPYRITFDGDKLYMVPGGRWTTQNNKDAAIMVYENGEWTNIGQKQISDEAGRRITDYTRLAVDPTDPSHWYVSAYGLGLHEWKDGHLKRYYLYGNSPLATSSTHGNVAYTRVDGVNFDSEGNVWLLNANNNNCLHVISPTGRWGQLRVNNGGNALVMDTPGDVLVDATRENYKWVVSSRVTPGLGLINDNGTPFDASDDRSVFRNTFSYSDSRSLTIEQLRCITQDREGNIWLGTNTGPLMVAKSTDFFSSNRCVRHIINRTDGSSLGDYMLGTEQINAIAVDGGGRIWFGTAASGAFLMSINSEDNDIRTIYHFTKTNSPLPSDNVISISINPVSGEVYFGTDGGLVSFRSDANEPSADFSSAYAFPNPVRPSYDGLLTITGLVADTEVRITNANGDLVYTGKSEGGMLVWNLRRPDGKRVTPGVYRIFGNSPASDEDKKHTAIKVLVM